MNNIEKDYLLQVRIKNAPLLRAMKNKGFNSISELSRASGISQAVLGKFANLQQGAFTKSGELRHNILILSELLGVMPNRLFPGQNFIDPLPISKGEREVNIEELSNFTRIVQDPIKLLEQQDASIIIRKIMKKLTPREERIIYKRFFEGKTLYECGEDFNVTRERVRQMEVRALRKLMKPENSKSLEGYIRSFEQ